MKIRNAFPLIMLFLSISLMTQAQKPCCAHGAKKSCEKPCAKPCSKTCSSSKFAALSEDEKFTDAHEEPEEMSEGTFLGKMNFVEVKGGENARIYEIKSPKETNSYLFVFHEWWGLNDHIKSEADNWYDKLEDVNVIALDLYDGQITDKKEEAAELMQSNDSERSLAIIDAVLGYVGKNASIATVGWCFGGGWSLQAAIEAGDNAKAAVMYYGMPEENMDRLGKLKADLLGVFAEQDDWINKELIGAFEKNLESLDKNFEFYWYDAPHAFANPSNPGFDEKATEDAKSKVLEFLNKAY